MSSAVVRGEPTPAQRYIDTVLDAASRARGRGALGPVSLAQVMHYCMTTVPHHVFMTNGATGVKTTNKQFLELSVPLARALRAKGLVGSNAMVAARNHERTVAIYLGLCFAGVVPIMVDPVSTPFELQHFIELAEPRVIFCDAATQEAVQAAAPRAPGAPLVVALHTNQLLEFAKGYGGDIDEYRVADADPETTLLMLPTSGSTGMPKAALFNHSGLIQHLASAWMYHIKFPAPTQRVMLLTTPQWGTFTMMLTSCCAFRIELLMSPELPTVDHVLHMLQNYRPTWTFFGPSFGKLLAKEATPQHFSSLETIVTLGSPVTPEIVEALKEKLPPASSVCDGYGMTEVQGFVALTDPGAPPGCSGPVVNILHYKLIKEDGTVADVGEEGELYLKGNCIIKGYHKNETELLANLVDGWMCTGDVFTRDEAGRLYYRRRIKFSFKYNNQLISPEEIEGLIGSLPFVAECVVCECEGGPAAAVVVRADCAPGDAGARRAIHDIVASTLSDHKRLRGGVALVSSLPRTHSGKAQRVKCAEMLAQLVQDGLCR